MNSPAPLRLPAHRSRWLILVTYSVLALLASGGLVVLQPMTGIDPEALSIVQFGPALAAGAVWLIWRGTISRLLPKPVPAKQVSAHTVLMIAACILMTGIVAVCATIAGTGFTGAVAAGGIPFLVILVLQLVGAAGEEIGWRGLMQPVLESRLGRFASALITGVVWALWHVVPFTQGPIVAIFFPVSTVAIAVLLGYLGTGSFWQRVLVASIGHWLINIGLYLVTGDQVTQYPQVTFATIGAVITTAAFLALFAAAQRKRAKVAAAAATEVSASR